MNERAIREDEIKVEIAKGNKVHIEQKFAHEEYWAKGKKIELTVPTVKIIWVEE